MLDATDGSSGNWWSEPNLVIVLDMGVSLNDSISSFGAGIAFIPASSFATVNNGFPLLLRRDGRAR